jgi:hypothetical protein
MQHKSVFLDPFLDEFQALDDTPSLSPEAGRRLDQKLREFRGVTPIGFLETALGQGELFDSAPLDA